jgi:zinc transport system permease protein
MLDDFFIRALIAGLGVAIVTGPLGCFTIWRRLSFFGDTLAHSALLGVTLALSFEMNISFAVFLISAVVAIFLINLQRVTNLPGDALLGLLAHSTLALGLVTISFLSFIRFDIMGLLFGDILSVNNLDILIIWLGGAIILITLKIIWKPLFASTVNYDLAQAEGMNPDRVNIIFTLLMAAIIAISIKMVGLLLITGMLIMPAAMARNLSDNPIMMVFIATVGGMLSVLLGLFASLEFNSPSGPSIIVAALSLFLLSLINLKRIKIKGKVV